MPDAVEPLGETLSFPDGLAAQLREATMTNQTTTTQLNGIDLEFITEDIDEQTLCVQYWQRGKDRWLHLVADIGEALGLRRHEVCAKIRTLCRAYPNEQRCTACSDYIALLKSRNDFAFWRGYDLCYSCREEKRKAETAKEKALFVGSLDKNYPDRFVRVDDILNRYSTSNTPDNYRDDPEFIDAIDEAISSLDECIHQYEGEVLKLISLLEYLEGLNEEYENDNRYFRGSYSEYLESEHWQEIRRKAMERAGARCMVCNTNDQILHVHHRTYERLGRELPMDVIVLCARHHNQFHNEFPYEV